MQPQYAYRVANDNVVRETFEDESVIVNLETGTYYSLQGTASLIWQLVEEGHTGESIEHVLSGKYWAEPGKIEACCRKFLEELLTERLIAASEGGSQAAPAPQTAAGTSSELFAEPILAKFSDMQELLLIDPIHETDTTGWPARKP